MSTKKVSLILLIPVVIAGLYFSFRSVGPTTTPADERTDQDMAADEAAPKSDHTGHSMTVASEREFIEQMIPHHQEAVDTAREVTERGGTTPAVRALVAGIIETQEKEIAMMITWHEEWYGEAYVDTGTYVPMMRELQELSGTELDRAFLEDMIGHHEGAVAMAQGVQKNVEHDTVRAFAQGIITTQTEEIREMRALMNTLSAEPSGASYSLQGKGLTEVPQDIFSKTDLVSLDLSRNAFTGALPAEVRHLTKLQRLDLSYNQFTGVPAEVGQLSELRYLNLSNNALTGLPYELGNLKKLEVLDLTGNDYAKADLAKIKEGLPAGVRIIGE